MTKKKATSPAKKKAFTKAAKQAVKKALSAERLAIQAADALRRAARNDLMRQIELARWTPLLILGVARDLAHCIEPDGTCPVCWGRRLEWTVLCLNCLRSGVDHLLDPVPKKIARHAYRPGRLPGGKRGMPTPKVVKIVPPKPKKASKKKRKAKPK